MRRLPDTFIIGAPKCGTTTLWALLQQHPDLFLCTPKEPNHFNTDLELAFGEMPYQDRALYESLFPRHVLRTGEASVWYLYSQSAIANIAKTIHNAHLIAVLRPPVQAVRSMHAFSLKIGGETFPDLGDAWNADPQRRLGKKVPHGVQIPQALFYRDTFAFNAQLRRALIHIPRERLHIILTEDLAQNPLATVADAFRFLDLDESFVPALRRANTTDSHRTRPFAHLARRFPRLRRALVRSVPQGPRLKVERALARLTKTVPPTPVTRPDTLLEIAAHYRPEVDGLSSLVQRDLSHWNHPLS